jgi:sodium/bile acid cotransporter 7
MMTLSCVAFAFSNDKEDEAHKRRNIQKMYNEYKKSFPGVQDISAMEAMEKMKQGRVIFVDVRSAEEQAVSMLPGAISAKEFMLTPQKYENHLIIAYCTIGYRSGKLAEKFRKKDIPMVNMRGGILVWLHSGGKVYREGDPVNRVHVFGKRWDLAPSNIESIS